MPQLKLEHQGRRHNSFKLTRILEIIGHEWATRPPGGGGVNPLYNSGIVWDCGVAVGGVQKNEFLIKF